jgi:hypothetical protein
MTVAIANDSSRFPFVELPSAWLASDKRDWTTAYHEAGHAFIAHIMRQLTGIKLILCTIQREPGDRLDGKCTFDPAPLLASLERPADWTDTQWQKVISLDADARVQILLAGEMAQFMYAKDSVTVQQSEDDLCKAQVILGYVAREEEIEGRLDNLRVQTALVLLDGWRAVKNIAVALVQQKTLSGADVAAICEAAFARCASEQRRGKN